jgi:BirA family biotin operon repressor/biotin-[acetyl-CoA-carboxylase] ligase
MDNEELSLFSTVVLADRQMCGIGRGRRRWVSPPGGLYLNWMSGISDDEKIARMPMLSASAAHAALAALGVADAAIKWPNDILVDHQKLAGLLIHARRGDAGRVTVGFGVNIHPVIEAAEDPIHPPISLEELGVECSSHDIVVDLAVHFVAGLAASLEDQSPAMERWRRFLIHEEGDSISVRLSSGSVATGTFAGLTDEGFLRLTTDDGERIITGGDVVES